MFTLCLTERHRQICKRWIDIDFFGVYVIVTKTSFKKDILDQTYITISDGKEFSTNSVQLYFDDNETSKVAELKKGDSVVIAGRCGDFSVFNLTVNDCKLK